MIPLTSILVLLVVPSLGQITDEEHGKAWLALFNYEDMRARNPVIHADWNYNTNITDENLQASIEAQAAYAVFSKEAYNGAMEFAWQDFSEPVRRQFSKITDIGTDVLEAEDLDRLNFLGSEMNRQYSTARVCNKPGDDTEICYPLDPDLTAVMATSRDWEELEWAFEGWRNESSRGMPDLYEEFAQLQNQAAITNGYDDAGDYWRSWYETEDLPDIVAKMWDEIKPLYQQLHAFVRKRLREAYPGRPFPTSGHIPAHLLGNMWAQQWNNIEELLRPYPDKPSVDVTDELIKQGYNTTAMFRLSEEFFTSLGLIPMTEDFWRLSMLDKPDDRDVVCHASAWDFYDQKDFRIKQCTEINTEWLYTTHHEMGHVEYFLQYKDQPTVFRDGANPGFHEAIGDVMELSVSTPAHLHEIGLLPDYTPDPELDMNSLMNLALRKIAFLPFGYLIDQWRWDLYRGTITKDNYNSAWWDLRCNIQGLSSPVPRYDGVDFDAGAKFHVPNNTPYIRYFISHVLQFQFHEALCKAKGHEGPVHQCSIYRSEEAGKVMSEMMEVGSSEEWPIVLERMTGSATMEVRPLVDYFQPLLDWLAIENEGEVIGWTDECPNNNASPPTY